MTAIGNELLPHWKQARLRAWWEGQALNTPCIAGAVVPPESALPQARDLEQFWTDVDFIIERKMAEIDRTTYYGCAVPLHYVDQGSSAMAGVLGCPLEFIDSETVWAHPKADTIDCVFETALAPEVPVYRRIMEITRRSVALASGHHYVGAFALEGPTDLLAALYGIEPFLIDTLTQPERVGRAVAHLNCLWLQAYRDIMETIAQAGNPGCAGWAGVWAPGPTFPLQEDVAYNLSPEVFAEYFIPALRERIAAMPYPFFHLDGIGSIPHLPALLDIEELPVIQWVPGAGHERLDQWYGLIRRILESGRSVQVYGQAAEVAPLVRAVGPSGLFITITDATHENMNDLLQEFPQD